MSKLADKLRKQREFIHELGGGKSIVIRRMSELEYVEFSALKELKAQNGDFVRLSDFITKFVVDWRGFVELDFDLGGDNSNVKYESELLQEWLADRLLEANGIAEAIWQAFFDFQNRKAEAEKKS